MKRFLLRGVCVLLLIGLLAGALTALLSAERQFPASPDTALTPLSPDRMLTDREPPSEPPTEPTEPTEPPSEPETEPETVPQTEPVTDPSQPPETQPGTEPVTEPATEPLPTDGPAPAPEPEQPHIVTDLENRVWTPDELTDGVLPFYAYAAGEGELSVRVYWKPTTSPANNGTRLTPSDDRNFSVRMALNTNYQFTIYLYRDGKQFGSPAVFYVSYRASLADDDHPTVGDAPPVVRTNRDGITTPVKTSTFTLVVTARKGTDGKPLYADHLNVRLDGELLTNPTGNAISGYEYVLSLEPPQRGDERLYTITVLAWDDEGNSTLHTVELIYQPVSDGDRLGTATVRIDATTVGLGIVDVTTCEVRQGDTAAQTLLQALEELGYDPVVYDGSPKKNGGFYLIRLWRGDLLYGASIDDRLWTLILRDGISLTGTPDGDSLGEHDYTWGAGWMYDVNGYYPGKGLSEWSLNDGDVLSLRFTLAWGKDVDGYGASGGMYGSLSSYCGIWRDGAFYPLEHSFVETARVAPTEAEDGYVERTCEKCGEVERETLPATGPAPTDPPTEPPTDPPTELPTEPPTEPPTDPAANSVPALVLRRRCGHRPPAPAVG